MDLTDIEPGAKFLKLFLKNGSLTKDEALEGLAELIASGRVGRPTSGGPPPQFKGMRESDPSETRCEPT